MESEKDIRGWEESLQKTKRFEEVESLLLPVRYDYQPRGFCGSVGSVKVDVSVCRSVTRTFLICFRRR